MRLISIIIGIILSLMLSLTCLADKAPENKGSKSSAKSLKGLTFRDKNTKNVSFTLSPTKAYISVSF